MDFEISDMGSVVFFLPLNDEARQLMDEMDIQDWQMWGNGFVVDHRVARDIVEWMQFNDLNLEVA